MCPQFFSLYISLTYCVVVSDAGMGPISDGKGSSGANVWVEPTGFVQDGGRHSAKGKGRLSS